MTSDEPEKVSDESDRASLIESQSNLDALEKTLRKIEKAPADFDGVHCIDCGEEIPQERLKTGAFRDIFCQTKHEKQQRDYRK